MIACKNVTHMYFHKQTVADPSEMLFSICWLFRDITYKSLTVSIVCTDMRSFADDYFCVRLCL